MKLSFHGAAGEVTGSCYLLDTGRARVLIDCGLFQGGPESILKNMRALPFNSRDLSAIVLTHAHLDHVGRMPITVRDGFKGRIYCTPPSIPLADLSLRDAAHLMAADFERSQRKRGQRGCPPGTHCGPLFDENDVTAMVRLMTAVPYEQDREIAPGISMRFSDAGHIIGSASLVLRAQSDGATKTIAFSGDIGERGAAILNDPTPLHDVDVMVMESTYGDRDHPSLPDSVARLHDIVRQAQGDGGKILIPSFAIGRTQTILYFLAPLGCNHQLKMPVVVDSPMAISVTKIYDSNKGSFDEDALDMIDKGCNPLRFPGLRMSVTGQESRALNDLNGPAVIIAGAGMCNGGRIVHHLRQHLSQPNTHLIIPGFQAQGTLGRRLVEKQKQVRILGQPVDVNAQVTSLGGFSAHAGRTTLIDWAGAACAGPKKPRLFLTHGEPKPRELLGAAIMQKFGVRAEYPLLNDSYELG
ncbi:MAG: MBL fold metallo-hydrolase [Phycisphaerales bacterium]